MDVFSAESVSRIRCSSALRYPLASREGCDLLPSDYVKLRKCWLEHTGFRVAVSAVSTALGCDSYPAVVGVCTSRRIRNKQRKASTVEQPYATVQFLHSLQFLRSLQSLRSLPEACPLTVVRCCAAPALIARALSPYQFHVHYLEDTSQNENELQRGKRCTRCPAMSLVSACFATVRNALCRGRREPTM